jgi:ATP-dependent RNA helicase DeaD
MTAFADLGLGVELLDVIEKIGYETPSPIQAQVIPVILKDEKDVIGQASTGTGKTAAFGLPIIEKLGRAEKRIRALIILPTRELAIQVSKQLSLFAQNTDLKVATVYGGQAMYTELAMFRSGVDIVVGTPGRLIDHLTRKRLDLSHIKYFVLDEFDEMLKMGFIEDIEALLDACPEEKRMLFFSATLPKQIQAVIHNYMTDYEHIKIETTNQTRSDISQFYYNIKNSDKFELLNRLILSEKDFYGLIFCRRKIDVDELHAQLAKNGVISSVIHGDISQGQRERVLEKFRKGENKILIATDVAARGIDVQGLGFVINYDFPEGLEDYTHRIGRTGRAGKKGVAISFIARKDIPKLHILNKKYEGTIAKGVVPTKQDVLKSYSIRFISDVEESDITIRVDFKQIAADLLERFPAEQIVEYFVSRQLNTIDLTDTIIENMDLSGGGFGGGRGGFGGGRSSFGGGRDRGERAPRRDWLSDEEFAAKKREKMERGEWIPRDEYLASRQDRAPRGDRGPRKEWIPQEEFDRMRSERAPREGGFSAPRDRAPRRDNDDFAPRRPRIESDAPIAPRGEKRFFTDTDGFTPRKERAPKSDDWSFGDAPKKEWKEKKPRTIGDLPTPPKRPRKSV